MLALAEMLWADEDFIGNSYPQEICTKILRSMERLSSVRPDRVIDGITPSEFSVLCCVYHQPRKNHGKAASVAYIASQMKVSVPMVSRTLRTLQEKNLIHRSVDENDRRSVQVTITPAGSEIVQKNLKRIIFTLNQIFSVFTEDEMRTIAELYSKFAAAMEDQLK